MCVRALASACVRACAPLLLDASVVQLCRQQKPTENLAKKKKKKYHQNISTAANELLSKKNDIAINFNIQFHNILAVKPYKYRNVNTFDTLIMNRRRKKIQSFLERLNVDRVCAFDIN